MTNEFKTTEEIHPSPKGVVSRTYTTKGEEDGVTLSVTRDYRQGSMVAEANKKDVTGTTIKVGDANLSISSSSESKVVLDYTLIENADLRKKISDAVSKVMEKDEDGKARLTLAEAKDLRALIQSVQDTQASKER